MQRVKVGKVGPYSLPKHYKQYSSYVDPLPVRGAALTIKQGRDCLYTPFQHE